MHTCATTRSCRPLSPQSDRNRARRCRRCSRARPPLATAPRAGSPPGPGPGSRPQHRPACSHHCGRPRPRRPRPPPRRRRQPCPGRPGVRRRVAPRRRACGLDADRLRGRVPRRREPGSVGVSPVDRRSAKPSTGLMSTSSALRASTSMSFSSRSFTAGPSGAGATHDRSTARPNRDDTRASWRSRRS